MTKLILIIKLGLGIVFCFLAITITTLVAFLALPASLQYHISEHYTVSVMGEDNTVYLGTLVPRSGPYQTIEGLRVSWDGDQVLEHNPCVDVVKVSGHVPAGSSQEAVIDYNVSVSHGLVLWNAQPDSCNLQPQCLIESDHPVIVAKANQIVNGTSWWDTYRIFNFTDHYLSSPEGLINCDMEKSALEAYESGFGECGEFSRLMVALCRASGIPSLVVSGIVLPDSGPYAGATTSTWDHPGGSHAWVEFSDGDIWSMADPAWGASTWEGLYFGRNDGRHISYGCINQEGEVYSQLRQWATQRGALIDNEFAALKFVATADKAGVILTPSVTVKKGWDGRWLNAILVLLLTTFVLCKLRNRFISQ